MKNNNQINVPQAREAGSAGGQMVKKNCPIRTLTLHRANRIASDHQIAVAYAIHIGA